MADTYRFKLDGFVFVVNCTYTDLSVTDILTIVFGQEHGIDIFCGFSGTFDVVVIAEKVSAPVYNSPLFKRSAVNVGKTFDFGGDINIKSVDANEFRIKWQNICCKFR